MRCAVLVMLSLGTCVQAAEMSVNLRVAPEYHQARENSPLFTPEPFNAFDKYTSRQELDLRYKSGGLNARVSARWQVHEHTVPDLDAVIDELYYDAALGAHYLSIGKKVLSWGVGFGFRPLDVVQRENRRVPYAVTQTGVPLLAWERFDAINAFSVVYANPRRGEARQPRDDEALAARYYRRLATADVYAVARASTRHKFELGAAFAQAVNEALAWHVEALYQRRYQQQINPLATASSNSIPLALRDPLTTIQERHGYKALAGFTWTQRSDVAWLAEAWYDGAAYSARQWQDLAALTRRQRSLLDQSELPDAAVYGNIAYNMRYFDSANLLRKNVLLRASYTGTAWSPALDVLYTPEDEGTVSTASLRYDRDRQYFEAGVRAFGGQSAAAYRLVPEKLLLYFVWQRALR